MLATAYSFLEYICSRITKFKNKGSDNICQTLIKRNLVFGVEFQFTNGIYIYIQPYFLRFLKNMVREILRAKRNYDKLNHYMADSEMAIVRGG